MTLQQVAFPMALKRWLWTLAAFLCALTTIAQEEIRLDGSEFTYNFGTINEADGLASHTFIIRNTRDAPLTITRVTVSCGCTRPEYSREPIAFGGTGELTITFDPQGYLGLFHKTIAIYSNGKPEAFRLAIQGKVTPTPPPTLQADTTNAADTESIAPDTAIEKRSSLFRRIRTWLFNRDGEQ